MQKNNDIQRMFRIYCLYESQKRVGIRVLNAYPFLTFEGNKLQPPDRLPFMGNERVKFLGRRVAT